MTVTLDYTGDSPDRGGLGTATPTPPTPSPTPFPVPPADWTTLLVPPAAGSFTLDQIWVRPVLDGTTTPATIDWTAYTRSSSFSWQ